MHPTLLIPEAQIRSILAHWPIGSPLQSAPPARHQAEFKLTSIESGFSGALIFRVDCHAAGLSGPSYALKATPASTPHARASTIAELITTAAPTCRLLAAPLPPLASQSPAVTSLGYRWELTRWIPGQPLSSDAAPDAIARGGEAIGKVHRALNEAAEKLGVKANHAATGPPRCITDRITRLQQLTPKIAEIAARNQSLDDLAEQLTSQLSGERGGDPRSNFRCRQLAESLLAGRKLLATRWADITPGLLRQLATQAENHRRWAASWVLRDVHRGHLLFSATDQDHVQGVLDYDALDWDTPAADLARWSGDFSGQQGGDADVAAGQPPPPLAAAVAGYQRICPFSECHFELSATLVDVNAVGGLANWLVWLTLENRQFRGTALEIRSRIVHLIASICRFC